ncbi:hypothetical protein ACOSP7_029010 [Xanthoceras sorbifolium]
MEEKRECYAKEREFGDESLHTVLFTAGTALMMACLKRFIVVLFIEQWRLWVFLLLNVVLLAIFFTSKPSTTSTEEQESEENVKVIIKRKELQQCGSAPESEESGHGNVKVEKCEKLQSKIREENDQKVSTKDVKNENVKNEDEDDDDDGEESPRLSKEELNERVEAFIATFRKQLVSDAIRGRDRYCFPKKKKEIGGNFVKLERRFSTRTSMNFSTQGANCFVL